MSITYGLHPAFTHLAMSNMSFGIQAKNNYCPCTCVCMPLTIPDEASKVEEVQELKQQSPIKAQPIVDASDVVSTIITSHQRTSHIVDQQPTSSAISHESLN